MTIISPENKAELIKRLKSFMWRFATMAVAITVSFLADNLNLFHVSGETAVVLGLILGEITKYMNNRNSFNSVAN